MAMSGSQGELNSEINVTPLVDVMLVLLVIFMITAPMMNTGVDIDLPETAAVIEEDPEGRLTLSIGKQGQLALGGTPVTWIELEKKLLNNERVQKERELYIEASRQLPYEVVVTAMAVAQNSGVTKLQMITGKNDDMSATLQQLDQGAASAPALVEEEFEE